MHRLSSMTRPSARALGAATALSLLACPASRPTLYAQGRPVARFVAVYLQ